MRQRGCGHKDRVHGFVFDESLVEIPRRLHVGLMSIYGRMGHTFGTFWRVRFGLLVHFIGGMYITQVVDSIDCLRRKFNLLYGSTEVQGTVLRSRVSIKPSVSCMPNVIPKPKKVEALLCLALPLHCIITRASFVNFTFCTTYPINCV